MKRMIRKGFFQSGTVVEDLESTDKYNAIRELLQKAPIISSFNDPARIEEAAIARERIYSTGIGRGVAIAHGKTSSVKDTVILLGISRRGIDFQSLDGEPVHLLFLIANPPEKTEEYLLALSTLARLMRKRDFLDTLRCGACAPQTEKLIAQKFHLLLRNRFNN